MKKYFATLLLLSALASGLPAWAQEGGTYEHIENFALEAQILPDAAVKIIEQIYYDFGPESKHGIYRQIPLYNSIGERLELSGFIVTVDGQSGTPVQVSQGGGQVEIKIGDPDLTITGRHVYIIAYEAKNAPAYFADYDELYWNVTGNEWTVPIKHAEALIYLPINIGPEELRASCYTGQVGEIAACGELRNMSAPEGGISAVYFSQNNLPLGAGLTVAAGFPKGLITEPTPTERRVTWLATYWPWFLVGAAFLLTLLAQIIAYFRRRQPPGTIVAQYESPTPLAPGEADFLLKLRPRPIIGADLIYLAVSGYLKLKKTKTGDYLLERLPEPVAPVSPLAAEILVKVFGEQTSVALSQLKGAGGLQPLQLAQVAAGSLLKAELLQTSKPGPKAVARAAYGRSGVGAYFVGLVFISFAVIFGIAFTGGNPAELSPLAGGIWAVLLLLAFWPRQAPATWTAAGLAERDYLLGLKLYIGTAEAARLKFHNAPEKNPEHFDALLPFAMIFGLETAWAKQFEGIYQTPPRWYEDGRSGAFNSLMLAQSLARFQNVAASTIRPASSSGGGSGGGGSSGGGGGGGGGGSW